jgi:predicted secreted hydrolase
MKHQTTPPVPVPPSASAFHFPADYFAHPEAPTEWWWHTGTLKAGDRTFGFEINAANFGFIFGFVPFGFSQVMLTDVANNAHYQQTAIQMPFSDWAQSDPSKDFYVRLGNSAYDPTAFSGWITMNAPQADPTRKMVVKAALFDVASGKIVSFDLTLSQQGPPFIVWGSGVAPNTPNPTVKTNNFYYSLTRLQASGTITLAGEVIPVTGVTWMDHEYGAFGSSKDPVKWFLQDMQLDNGVHISNSVVFPTDHPPTLNVPATSGATIQFPDGTLYYEKDCTLTPIGATWQNPTTKVTFFLEFTLYIPGFDASLTITSLVPGQDFPFPFGIADTYEGVATATGTFNGQPVIGTAWNEQQP